MIFWLLGCRVAVEPGVPDRPLPVQEDTGSLVVGVGPVAVWINEMMPENDSTWQAPDGSLPPWGEVRNGSDGDIQRSDLRINSEAIAWVEDSTSTPDTGDVDSGANTDSDVIPAGAVAMFTLPDDGAIELSWQGVRTDSLDPGDLGPDYAWARFDAEAFGEPSAWERTAAPTPGYDNGNHPPEGDPSDLFFADYSRIDLTIPKDSWDSLTGDPYTAVAATLSYERIVIPVQIHLKGVYGSLRTLEGKAAFSVDINAARPGGTMRGLKKLKLNNMVQDPSGVHEHLTYGLMRAAGMAAPRVGYLQVYVNGEYWGVYANVEAVDDVFLDRNFGEHGGNLYEGAYGVDFVVGGEFGFECDECAFPDDRSDITAVATVLDQAPTNAAIAQLESLVDLDQFLTEYAIEQVTLHWDGYATANNYRVFNDPGQGRFVIIPWGADQTWIDGYFNPFNGYGRIMSFCIANESCLVRYKAKLIEMADLTEAQELPLQLRALLARYDDDFLADPRKEWDASLHSYYLSLTLGNLRDGPDRVRAEVAAY